MACKLSRPPSNSRSPYERQSCLSPLLDRHHVVRGDEPRLSRDRFCPAFAVTDFTLIRAQGKLVVILAAMLHGAGVTPFSEFAAKLGIYAVAVSDDEPAEGQILAYWAGMVREMAPPESHDPLGGKPVERGS
jgi:hypothetical protein